MACVYRFSTPAQFYFDIEADTVEEAEKEAKRHLKHSSLFEFGITAADDEFGKHARFYIGVTKKGKVKFPLELEDEFEVDEDADEEN